MCRATNVTCVWLGDPAAFVSAESYSLGCHRHGFSGIKYVCDLGVNVWRLCFVARTWTHSQHTAYITLSLQVQEAVWASGRMTAPHLTTRVRFRSSAASIKGYLKALRSATLQAEQQADAATAAAVSTTSATSVPQRSAAAPARRSSAVIQVASILSTLESMQCQATFRVGVAVPSPHLFTLPDPGQPESMKLDSYFTIHTFPHLFRPPT